MNPLSKMSFLKPLRLRIDNSIEEIEIDLSIQRVIIILGTDRDGKEKKYVLKVTRKGGLILS